MAKELLEAKGVFTVESEDEGIDTTPGHETGLLSCTLYLPPLCCPRCGYWNVMHHTHNLHKPSLPHPCTRFPTPAVTPGAATGT